MKIIFTFLFAVILLNGLNAQTQNALDFDGIDDQVIVPNGGALISTGTGISMGMWVYPRNTAPNFPNLDCFGGFRNNVDADFYIIQINASSVEARFRNSAGVSFDIVFAGLQLNVWQHFVFTFDGTQTKLFHNGIEVGTTIANGSITNVSETFYIGNGLYQGTEFTMDGKADEIVLFDRGVSPQEINCLYKGAVDTTASGLKLYYNCNQGVADGNNAGITNLNGLSTQPAGTLANFALSGTTSNWVSGMNFISSASASFCSGTTYTLGSQTFNAAGTYLVTIAGSGGCDSTVSLTLSMLQVDTTLIRINTQLTTTGLADSYQWVDCNNNFSPINGATQGNYNVTVDGSYAVIITDGNCVDTSRCVNMSVEGLRDMNLLTSIQVYPIPANEVLILESKSSSFDRVCIVDYAGRLVLNKDIVMRERVELNIEELNRGFYFLKTYKQGQVTGVAKFNKN
jgi:hypothetical protein